MTADPCSGAFPHQHHDPRGLRDRIEAQLRDRIEEAVHMAGLKLMADLRERRGGPAPDASSDVDRRESERIAAELLAHLHNAFRADLVDEERAELERVEAGSQGRRERVLAGQAFLARRLPDYWQRFEAHQAAYIAERLETPPSKQSWLSRLFGD